MKINKIQISKLLSFGTLQSLYDLGDYNLLIGKNGAGKTNIFKILKNLPVEFIKCAGKNVFIPEINRSEDYRNTETAMNATPGLLEINYEITKSGGIPVPKKIKYSGSEFVMKYIEGDITFFKNQITYFESELAIFEIQSGLQNISDDSVIHILNIGISYIFDKKITFSTNGKFTQNRNASEEVFHSNIKDLPSGVLQFVSIFYNTYNSLGVLLLDEPELHLEPRSIRKLLWFFIWIMKKNKPNKNIREEVICNHIDSHVANCFPDSKGREISITVTQLFIASHSPIFINEFLMLGKDASIHEFSFERNDVTAFKNFSRTEEHEIFSQNFSRIRRVENDYSALLFTIGSKGSDLLQANGVIWVEGPSDVIYIQRWIEMYADENAKPRFQKGTDYEFAMYGGALLVYLYGNERACETEKKTNLVNILNFNKNNFLITDKDREDQNTKNESAFENAKKYFKDYLGDSKFWSDELLRTIEMYCLEENPDTWKYHTNCIYSSKTGKIEKAFQRVKLWENRGVKLTSFHDNLNIQLSKLYDCIKIWNDHEQLI